MNAETQVGEMARTIWNSAGSHGEMTPADFEITADASPQLLDFALGWLARENNVDIFSETTGTKIQLEMNRIVDFKRQGLGSEVACSLNGHNNPKTGR